jgi:hypothetical protein
MKSSTMFLTWLAIVTVVGSLVAVLNMAMGDYSFIEDPVKRAFVCAGLALWAFIYFVVGKTKWKIAFGIIQVLAALWSDWYQLGKIASGHGQIVERLTFVAGALVVLAHGFKDIFEGLELTGKKAGLAGEPPTPLSNVSSEAPDLD